MQLAITWRKLSSELGRRLGIKVRFKELRLEPKIWIRSVQHWIQFASNFDRERRKPRECSFLFLILYIDFYWESLVFRQSWVSNTVCIYLKMTESKISQILCLKKILKKIFNINGKIFNGIKFLKKWNLHIYKFTYQNQRIHGGQTSK